jgi:hypothetical protein
VTEYTVEDLVRHAHERGFTDVTHRLVVDWVQKGLIDQATRSPHVGAGSGRGSRKGTWSQFQRDLFLREVDQHHDQAEKIATLCNIPVSVWLWWGDDWVPLRQVARVMDTYCKAYRRGSAQAARRTARDVAADLGNPGGTHAQRRLRQDFIAALADMSPTRRITDHQRRELTRLAARVFDPKLLATPFARGLTEGYVQLIDARYRAIARLPGLTADDYFWARHLYLVTRIGYGEDYPKLAEDPVVAARFGPPTLDEIGNRACIELLTVIGLVDMAEQDMDEQDMDEQETDPERGAYFDRRRSPLLVTTQDGSTEEAETA